MPNTYYVLFLILIGVFLLGLAINAFFRAAIGKVELVYETAIAVCPCHSFHGIDEIGQTCVLCEFKIEPLSVMDEGW